MLSFLCGDLSKCYLFVFTEFESFLQGSRDREDLQLRAGRDTQRWLFVG